MIFAKLICKFRGHLRMKRINEPIGRLADFRCDRCGHTETRKVYARKVKRVEVA